MNKFILSIQNHQITEVKLSGGKGSTLARLVKAGFNVPPFFILSTLLYEHIIKINNIDQISEAVVSQHSLESFKQIQSAILAAKIPQTIITLIHREFKNLIQNSPAKTVAVRSSALAEDLEDRSFAGQLESYLDVQDEKQLLGNIKRCWASLWNERVHAYLARLDKPLSLQPIAVIVQQMIPAEYSGICFTIDPTDIKPEWMMIEAWRGIGTEIFGGKVKPSRYRIHRKTTEIKADFLNADDEQSGFSESKISDLSRTCLKIEGYFKTPQDIEWACHQDEFYIVQSRPITARAVRQPDDPNRLWTNYFFGERFPQPVSPLGWSLLKPLIEKNAFREPLQFLGFPKLACSQITKCFYGRPYTKLAVFRALHSLFPTAYVSLDKRQLLYDGEVSIRDSLKLTFCRLFPILSLILNTTDWIPPVHLRNWRRFLNFYQEKVKSLNNFYLQSSSDQQLWQVNLQAEQLSDRLLNLHRWSITFAELIYHFLAGVIKKWLAVCDTESIMIDLHRGLSGNKTVEMNLAIWEITQKTPQASEPDHNNKNGLSDKPKIWCDFLRRHGHRSSSLDISLPTWSEDQTFLDELINQYRAFPSRHSPQLIQAEHQNKREATLQQIVKLLSTKKLGCFKVNIFSTLLNWSQQLIVLRENQRYHWHQALAINRKVFLELGKRFIDRGWLEQQDQIFYLTRNEIEKAIFNQTFISKIKIEKRLTWHQQWQKIQPPALINESASAPSGRQITGKKLVGIRVSPGVATGKARVLTGLPEMSQLQPGEILVVPTTDPGWTPLFGVIKGLVMEVGGVLSHGAIIAREFGIAAVTNVLNATSHIQTGISLTVDGDKGIVWINEEQAKL